jgi:heme A synthase
MSPIEIIHRTLAAMALLCVLVAQALFLSGGAHLAA